MSQGKILMALWRVYFAWRQNVNFFVMRERTVQAHISEMTARIVSIAHAPPGPATFL